MAFGDLAVHMIIFIAVVSLATGVVVAMKYNVDRTATGFSDQQRRIASVLKTEFAIEVINHIDADDQSYVYIKNTGDSIIDIDIIDVFTDNIRIPRNDANRTIEILSDTDTKNVGNWDPGEQIMIIINQSLSSSTTHIIKVTSDNSIADEEQFSF